MDPESGVVPSQDNAHPLSFADLARVLSKSLLPHTSQPY